MIRFRHQLFSSRLLATALLVGTLALPTGAAWAQAEADVAEYKAHVDAGTSHFQASRFDKARSEFEAAYAIHPEPTLLFNIASTHRRQGNDREALATYRKFLDEAPPDHPQRKRAESTVTELEAEAVLSGQDIAGGEDAGETPTGAVEPEPSPAESDGGEDGASATSSEQVASVSSSDSELGPGSWWKIAGAASMVGGVVFLVGAGIEGRRASSREDELERDPGGDWTPYLMETYEEGQSAERRAVIFGVSGAVLIGAGAVLYWVGHNKASESRGTSIGALSGKDQFGIAVSGAF